jgi:hypothetical protein
MLSAGIYGLRILAILTVVGLFVLGPPAAA